ncbi:MAG: hypothetical protein LBJ00_07960 [Planctomycetaceae bacterium]|nr:hypothetical protein [Planctomycetaceae bacterium]
MNNRFMLLRLLNASRCMITVASRILKQLEYNIYQPQRTKSSQRIFKRCHWAKRQY